MAIVLFTVRATITPDQEAAFNEWYDNEHCAQLLRFNGAVSARRYKALQSDDQYQYMAVYEFRDEATFARFEASGEFAELKREYEASFGGVSERVRNAWVQIMPA
jgi:antibiotic biosynthesis monooxygenase (ABM) superfamily enzyme